MAAAYLSEIYRAGIEAIHSGQMEAALSLGMTPLGSMRYIVLPQAIRTMLPPITNFSIMLLKDTALVSVVAVPEIMALARNLVTETFQSMHVYLIAAAIYLCDDHPDVAARRPSRTHAPGLELRRPRHAAIVRDL